MHLRGIGAAIWGGVQEGVTIDELVAHVVTIHGAHPSAEDLVAKAIGDLVSAGALVQERPVGLAQVLEGNSTDSVVPWQNS